MVACSSCASDVGNNPNRPDPLFRRVLWIALIVNGGMFLVEIIASYLGDSMSLQADALDFFGDAANYAISLFVLGMSVRLRARASMIKGVSMGLFGLWVIFNAGYRALNGSEPDASIMGGIAAVALLANVSVALMLFRYRTGDSNMRSIWLCSRNDAIGNLAVMIAAAGVFASASRWPDLIVAGIISSLSLTAAYQVIRMARDEMRTGQVATSSSPQEQIS
ncbi:MAG: cation diffusion facilitator family transporter [Pseudomonadota bacterium]